MSDLPHIHDFVCFSATGCPLDREVQEPSDPSPRPGEQS